MLVARLRAAGCVVVGKTNAPEFADLGGHVQPGLRRPPATRTTADRVAGGSSGGAAVAVAAGMVPLATASDGGGSIRIPASACGLPGFKPSLGRVPDGGPHPVDWPLVTTRGVITRPVADLVAALDVVVGAEPSDLRSLPTPCEPFSAGCQPGTPSPAPGSPGVPDWGTTGPSRASSPPAPLVIGPAGRRGASRVVEIDRVFELRAQLRGLGPA